MSTTISGVPMSIDRVFTVHGDDELWARAGHLFDPHEEFVCAASDMSTWARTSNRSRVRLAHERLGNGLTIRKLYTPTVLNRPEDGKQLAEISRNGVRIRIYPGVLGHEAIIIDRKVAILAGPPVAGVRSYSVVDAPEVVAALRALFQAAWESAADLDTVLADMPPVVDEEGLSILRMLAAGRKDESAARTLRMSVRTYRRRVAELMVVLGADSRFQAGVRAKALGLPV
ncbi:MAG TPA: DNA-binding response regulator [Pseudonocardiaceae bacterium]|jgi:hypothetical protein|nr:DNA-binding response regulator [Pseudonocardiaceae bacterium]